jgi:phage gpG-like protein
VAYVVLSGIKELAAALTAIRKREGAATGRATGLALHTIERKAKELLSKTSSAGEQGRDAQGRYRKVQYTASPPGEPPFLRTGTLRRSVQVEGPTPTGPTSWMGQVGPTAVYGRIQELGGTAGRGSVLPARPYMLPAFDDVKDQIARLYREAWAAALRG